jgi:hypothetical protein
MRKVLRPGREAGLDVGKIAIFEVRYTATG